MGREAAAAAFSAAAGGAVGLASALARPIALSLAASTAARALALTSVCWACEPSGVVDAIRTLRVDGRSVAAGAAALLLKLSGAAGLQSLDPKDCAGSVSAAEAGDGHHPAPAPPPQQSVAAAGPSWSAGGQAVAALLQLLSVLCSGAPDDDSVPRYLEGSRQPLHAHSQKSMVEPNFLLIRLSLPSLTCCVTSHTGLLEALAAPTSGLPPSTRCSAQRALRAAFSRCGGRTPLGDELGGFLTVTGRSGNAPAPSLFSDAVLVAGDSVFAVSRAVLFARCPALLRGASPPSQGEAGVPGQTPSPVQIRMGPSVPADTLHLLLRWAFSGSCELPPAAASVDQLRRLAKATGLHVLAALARPAGGTSAVRRTDRNADISQDLGRLLAPGSGGAAQQPAEDFPPFWDVPLVASPAPPPGIPGGAGDAPSPATIGAHRVVLVARSQYLRALLSPGAFRDASGGEVAFPEITAPGALRALRWWLYTDEQPWAPVAATSERAAVLASALEAVQVHGETRFSSSNDALSVCTFS